MFKMVNGVRAPMTPEEIAALEPVLSEVQEEARKQVNAWRDAQENAGVSVLGHDWDTNSGSREKLQATIQEFQDGMPIPEGFIWTSADDVDVPISDLADLIAIRRAIFGKGLEIHLQHRSFKLRIEAVEATEEDSGIEAVEAIVSEMLGTVQFPQD